MKQPIGYLFRADSGWFLLYYRPNTHVVPVVSPVGQSAWDIADYLTRSLKLVVKFADTDQESWGRIIIKDRGIKVQEATV